MHINARTASALCNELETEGVTLVDLGSCQFGWKFSAACNETSLASHREAASGDFLCHLSLTYANVSK